MLRLLYPQPKCIMKPTCGNHVVNGKNIIASANVQAWTIQSTVS